MKRKIFRFLGVGLVLALVLSLVPLAGQVGATVTYMAIELGVTDTDADVTAEWSTAQKHSGNYAVNLDTTSADVADEARIRIEMAEGTTLNDIVSISWWRYIQEGFAPHLDIILDLNGDGIYDSAVDDALVFQYAYNPWGHVANLQGNFWGAEAGAWRQTFSDSGTPTGPAAVDNTTSGWATTGAAGGPEGGDADFILFTLEDWKLGQTYTTNAEKTINGNTLVLALEIEVDYWAAPSNAYIDDIEINGVTYDLEPVVLDAEWYKTGDTVDVTVYNGNDSGTTSVFVKSTTVGTGGKITLALSETGTGTGIFVGSFDLVGTTPGTGELLVDDADTVDVTPVGDWGAGSQATAWASPATVDDILPVIIIVSPAVSANITEVKPLIKATYEDAHSGIADNTTTVMTLTGPDIAFTATDSQVTYTPSDNLTDGSYTVTVDVSDAAGNAATQASWSFTVDTVNPTITVATPAVVPPNVSSNITFTATVADATSGVDTVTINVSSIDSATALAMTDDGGGTYSVNVTTSSTVTEATYPLLVTATDYAGNNDSANITLVVSSDTTAPVIASPAITYLYGLSSAPPGGTVTISANVTEAVGMGIVTAASTAFTGSVSLLDGGSAPDVTAGDDIYTGTGTVASVVAGDYTVTITAEDAKGNEATPVSLILTIAPAVTGYDIDLVEGWNLISLPLIPTDDSIDVVLADISDNVSQVRTFVYVDGVLTEKFWMEGGTVGLLDDMVDGQGYWIEMTEAKTLTVQGSELPGAGGYMPEYDVYEGWNLIGFKSLDESTDAEAYLGGAVTLIFERMYGYDASGGIYIAILPGTDLEPGQGYWLAVSADGTIYP